MPTFDSIEQSVQSGRPVELFDFVAPVKTWRLTTHDTDITFGSNVYTATTGVRSNLAISTGDSTSDVVVSVPANHDLAKTYVAGLPPNEVLVTVTRYHPASNVFAQLWKGYASGVEFRLVNGVAMALFTVPDFLSTALTCSVPGVVASRVCNHVLGDGQCTVTLSSFQVATTISAISADGLTITIAGSIPAAVKNVDWSLHGALKHTASTESRTIISQVSSTQFVLQAPLPNGVANVGDAVTVYAGCNKSLDQCAAKFTNAPNFGGYPVLPVSNVFVVGLINALYHQYQAP